MGGTLLAPMTKMKTKKEKMMQLLVLANLNV